MLSSLGPILISYAVFVLVQAFFWRRNFLNFIKELLDSAHNIITKGKEILNPISDSAQAVRDGASGISNAATQVENIVPPILNSIESRAESSKTTIETYLPELSSLLESLPKYIEIAITDLADLLKGRIKLDLKSFANDVREIRLLIDDPEWCEITDAVLNSLNNDDKMPKEIIDKLETIKSIRFENLSTFDARLQQSDLLGSTDLDKFKDEMVKFKQNIFERSRDPNNKKDDAIRLIESIAKTIFEENDDDSIAETLVSAGKSLDKVAEVVGALVALILGGTAPAALGIFELAAAVVIVKEAMVTVKELNDKLTIARLNLKAGQLYNKKFDLPDLPNIDWPGPGSVNLPNLPDIDIKVPPADIPLRLGLPSLDPRFIPFLDQLVEKAERARKASEKLLDPELPFDVSDKINETGDRLKKIKPKLEAVTLRLTGVNHKIIGTVSSLDVLAKNLDDLADNMAERAENYITLKDDIISDLTRFIPATNNALNSVVSILGGVAADIGRIKPSVPILITDIRTISANITDLANTIDDGKPFDSNEKSDIAKKIYDFLKSIEDAIPIMSNIEAVVQPIFSVIVALHIGILIAGLWLVWQSLFSMTVIS